VSGQLLSAKNDRWFESSRPDRFSAKTYTLRKEHPEIFSLQETPLMAASAILGMQRP
jgi:hypothetical protein